MSKKRIAKPVHGFQAPVPKPEQPTDPLDSLELAINTGAQQMMNVTQQFLRDEVGNRITQNNAYSLEVKVQRVLQEQLGAALRIVTELKAAEKSRSEEKTSDEPKTA